MNETTENTNIPDSPAMMQAKEGRYQKWDLLFKAFTTLAIIVGSSYGLIEYFNKRDKELAEQERQYQLALYKERKETLYPLCNAAADIASSKSLKEAEKAIKTFETLSMGEVGIIADGKVDSAIKSFKDFLIEFMEGPEDASPPVSLIEESGKLALTCKDVLNLKIVYGVPGKQ